MTFFSLFSLGCFGIVPTALAAAAIVDILRVRAEWYWLVVALFIPVLGPAAYFLVSYGPWANRLGRISPAAARRAQTKRRLRELEIQLQHWRGPSILAEAGELLLSLNKKKRAEALLQEAYDAGAEPKECYLPLATVLQIEGGRWDASLPLLRALVDLEPDYKFGAARLTLARTLDELGESEQAEGELQAVLVKRNPPEAKVRLARLLLRRGDGEQAARLLSEVQADAEGMPTYLRREHGPWLRAAKRLKATTAKLPAPRVEGLAPAQPIWRLAVAAITAVAVVGFFVAWISNQILPIFEGSQEMMERYGRLAEVSERLDALRKDSPSTTDLGELELDTESLQDLLDLRQVMGEACSAAAIGDEAMAANASEGSEIWSPEGFERQIQLAEILATEMELRGLVVEDIARHLALVDWRFLGRPQAVLFDLPTHFRGDYLAAGALLDQEPMSAADVGIDYKRINDRQRQDAEAKIDDFRISVDEKKLAEKTRNDLGVHRQELESSLVADCLPDLQRMVAGQMWGYGEGDW